MGNLVTKEEALEALQRIFDNCDEIDNHLPEEERSGYKMYPDYNIVWLYLTAPEKRGKWVNVKISILGDSSAECSLCGAVVHNNFSNAINYCPNCGAKMEE